MTSEMETYLRVSLGAYTVADFYAATIDFHEGFLAYDACIDFGTEYTTDEISIRGLKHC